MTANRSPLALIDLPPVWMVGLGLLAGVIGGAEPAWPGLVWPGRILIAAGLALALWAAWEFRRARTTIIPRERPSALVEAGPYRFSRNPIYLADLLILAGWCLSYGIVLTVVFVALLAYVLETRFIRPEERVLTEDLGAPYKDYKTRVRRWI